MQKQRRERREPDYTRLDNDEPCRQVVRCYFDPAIIVQVCREHGIAGYGTGGAIEIIQNPQWNDWEEFVVIKLHCSKNQLKRAQFEWAQRLIQNPPKPIKPATSTEVDLFL